MAFLSSCVGNLTSRRTDSDSHSNQALLSSNYPQPYNSTNPRSNTIHSFPPHIRSPTDHMNRAGPTADSKPFGPGIEARGQGNDWIPGCTFCGVGDKEGFNVVYQVSSIQQVLARSSALTLPTLSLLLHAPVLPSSPRRTTTSPSSETVAQPHVSTYSLYPSGMLTTSKSSGEKTYPWVRCPRVPDAYIQTRADHVTSSPPFLSSPTVGPHASTPTHRPSAPARVRAHYPARSPGDGEDRKGRTSCSGCSARRAAVRSLTV